MKRKILLAFLTLTLALCCACTVIACGDDDNGGKPDEKHTTHTYDKKVADAQYLKSAATCTKKAEYYFSCECGEKGTETFEYGDLAAHVFNSYTSDNNATCVKDGTETSKCANCSATDTRTEKGSANGKHSFTDYKPDNNATCVKNGTETAKCDNCGATDTRDIPDSKTAHTYDKQVASAEYLASEANCSQKAKYYFSCECGAKGEDVFEHGGLGVHSLKHVEKTAATCTAAGVREHWVCSVCENKFSDANCSTVVTDTVIAANGHSNWQDNVCGVCGYDAGGTKELYYKLSDERDSYSIVKSSVTESNIVIPATYNGLKVTEVADGAFKDNSLIIKVTIGDNVETIGNEAFSGCVSLTEAVIGDGVTTVGYDAFFGCRLLAKVTVGNSIKDMNVSVFEGCRSLKSVSLPDGLTSIGYATFSGCTSLESVSLPASLTNIGEMAFYNATSLTEIKYRGDIAGWCGVEGTARIIKLVYVGDEKLSEITKITVPDGVGKIAAGAFSGLSALESVSIGKDVKFIGGSAFSGCKALTSVNMSAGVTEIGPYAFSECDSLESIVLPSKITVIGEWTFFGCKALKSVTLPAGLTGIEERAFGDCDSIAEIKYEGDIEDWCKIYGLDNINGFDYITDYEIKLFIGGEEIKDLIIPAGVGTIADSAFRGCALESVVIENGVTKIGNEAFSGCKSLSVIEIPESVTSLGYSAFKSCTSLVSITFKGTKAQWEAFGYSVDCTVHCSDGDLEK